MVFRNGYQPSSRDCSACMALIKKGLESGHIVNNPYRAVPVQSDEKRSAVMKTCSKNLLFAAQWAKIGFEK